MEVDGHEGVEERREMCVRRAFRCTHQCGGFRV
jgi:hypothetical protein